jgi:hypothetical protein
MHQIAKTTEVAKEIHTHASVLAELARDAGLEVVAYLLDWVADESGPDRDSATPKRIM